MRRDTRINKLLFFTMLVTGFTFNSCIRSFIPTVEKYNELLVVDGTIHDGPGPYTIKLSKSVALKQLSTFVPYTNCTVWLEDNVGNKVMLSEKNAGIYQTDSIAIRGVPGRSYKLIVATDEGEFYESTPEVMPEPVKIQSVYGEVEHKSDPEKFFGRDGYQFYVDAQATPNTNYYLFWRMQCTYKFRTDYPINCYYDNGLHPVFYNDSLRTCYRTSDILDVFLLNPNELQQKEVKRIPINYEDNYSKALTIRYSLKVSQFTINKEAFNYWSSIKKMIDAGGELYTQQPYQVQNNLKNKTQPEKSVLGYFMVAGLSETRIFINPVPFVNRDGVCIISKPQLRPLSWFEDSPDSWPVFYADDGGPYYVDQECVDCRRTGTLQKPPFWKD